MNCVVIVGGPYRPSMLAVFTKQLNKVHKQSITFYNFTKYEVRSKTNETFVVVAHSRIGEVC